MTTKTRTGPATWMGRSAEAAAHSVSGANASAQSEIENLKSKMDSASCGDQFWDNDLTAMPIASFDQPGSALLCEDCLAEIEEKEEICKDFRLGVSLPSQLEMTMAMV